MNDLYTLLLWFEREILSIGHWGLRAYRESSDIVYCIYSDLSVVEPVSSIFMYIYIWIGASEPRTYTVDLY